MMDIGSYEFLRAGATGYLGRKGSTMRRQSLAVIVVLAFLGALLFQSGIAAAAAADSGRVVNGAASSVWYLAEGSTAWGFYTRVTIENPNNSRLHARLTYMTRDGEVDGGVVSLAPESQTTINPADVLGQTDFSTRVKCVEGDPIAVDRTMTWTSYDQSRPYGPDTSMISEPYPYYYGYDEGHSSVGVTAPTTTWYLPEGCSAYGFETWLLIQNPNVGRARCTITYMTEDAGPIKVVKYVAGGFRASFNMKDDIGEKSASIEVDSDVPVIPERATYKNNRRAGSDSIGATTPAQDYYLAEGTTAWGFTTFLLVQNPNGSPVQVTVYCRTPKGEKVLDPIKVLANSRRTIKVNDLLPNTDVSFRVHGSAPIVAERSMYWDNGTGEASHDAIGMPSLHMRFYLPDGNADERDTWTLVDNPNPAPVKIEIAYFCEAGIGDVWFTDTIPARSRKSYNMSDRLPYGRASTRVTSLSSGRKIMVERSMYWYGRGAGTNTIGAFSD
jgi:hypothetical protein